MLDFEQRKPTDEQAARIKAAFREAWKPFKDVSKVEDMNRRYQLTLQHASLPPGQWKITRHDVISKQSKIIADSAKGRFTFDAPNSRAVLFHFQKTP